MYRSIVVCDKVVDDREEERTDGKEFQVINCWFWELSEGRGGERDDEHGNYQLRCPPTGFPVHSSFLGAGGDSTRLIRHAPIHQICLSHATRHEKEAMLQLASVTHDASSSTSFASWTCGIRPIACLQFRSSEGASLLPYLLASHASEPQSSSTLPHTSSFQYLGHSIPSTTWKDNLTSSVLVSQGRSNKVHRA